MDMHVFFTRFAIAAVISEKQTIYPSERNQNETIEIGPGNLKLIYSGSEGKLAHYVNGRSSASGAYIFHPNGTYFLKSEAQITRVYKENGHVEVEFIVGPIPVDDGIGKDIVTKLNLGIYLEDNNSELSILVDRAMGGTSIADGQLELMLHRRLLHDDSRGVAEALNETTCALDECTGLTILGKYYLRIDPLGEGGKWRRSYSQEIYSPFVLAFEELQDGEAWTNSHVATFSGMDPSYVLPDNVAILTLQPRSLNFHFKCKIGEDKDLSVMASVELIKVFQAKKINKIAETSLSSNQERAKMEKKRVVWEVEGSSAQEPKVVRGGPVDPTTLVIELAPMEISTFIVEFDSNWSTSWSEVRVEGKEKVKFIEDEEEGKEKEESEEVPRKKLDVTLDEVVLWEKHRKMRKKNKVSKSHGLGSEENNQVMLIKIIRSKVWELPWKKDAIKSEGKWETIQRLFVSNVLAFGMQGLSVEIVKNLVLVVSLWLKWVTSLFVGLKEDAKKLVSLVGPINENSGDVRVEDINPKLLWHFPFSAKAILNSMDVMIDGIMGQEVVKACSIFGSKI
ncbi:unnamed protein product [Dovyalis caffra]|uniref:Glycosyl hydrolase family 38 C-terminal domain-containing protein n=1 Tax=Dovyalis caffra TaxID=77055 RepID=A0AAV1RN65_9ROSI|nr:unnamed protein product [Dovyalis caffra]